MKTITVCGLPFAATDYQGAAEEIIALSKSGRPASVAACATHPVAEAGISRDFLAVLKGFTLLLPDGMPVVWLMNLNGARLKNKVYGPYLMRFMIERTPAPYRHYLFGGSLECLGQLETQLKVIQPKIIIAGSMSPPYRPWTEEDQRQFATEIGAAQPDFVWVALGGGKQERWIYENLHRYKRGVFLAVGDAFELIAGRRPFAPDWMHRAGLAWVYRFVQEPRRLWKRYLIYNSIFVVVGATSLFQTILQKTKSFFCGRSSRSIF
jgi:N-acetylglucosaminyldiphosphoundecaprenol N-acetyl-beta-D-mannosaminyltransferase